MNKHLHMKITELYNENDRIKAENVQLKQTLASKENNEIALAKKVKTLEKELSLKSSPPTKQTVKAVKSAPIVPITTATTTLTPETPQASEVSEFKSRNDR